MSPEQMTCCCYKAMHTHTRTRTPGSSPLFPEHLKLFRSSIPNSLTALTHKQTHTTRTHTTHTHPLYSLAAMKGLSSLSEKMCATCIMQYCSRIDSMFLPRNTRKTQAPCFYPRTYVATARKTCFWVAFRAAFECFWVTQLNPSCTRVN